MIDKVKVAREWADENPMSAKRFGVTRLLIEYDKLVAKKIKAAQKKDGYTSADALSAQEGDD